MFANQPPQPEDLRKMEQIDAPWARGLSVEERFSIYKTASKFVAQAQASNPDWGPAECEAWFGKLAARMRWIRAFPEYRAAQRQQAAVPDTD